MPPSCWTNWRPDMEKLNQLRTPWDWKTAGSSARPALREGSSGYRSEELLINDPAFILADEPTGNLDSHSAVKSWISSGGQQKYRQTLLLITHDERIALKADRVSHDFRRTHPLSDLRLKSSKVSEGGGR